MLISVVKNFCYLILFIGNFCLSSDHDKGKFRFCATDGSSGNQKRTLRYCAELHEADSKVRCVLGEDRSDCLRKISKNQADFAVLTSEDLITAANSALQVLITNELRFSEDEFEYKVVAIFDKTSGIKSRHDLQDKKFCHPGYGYESEWTKILSNYLEASLVPQFCQPELTLTENRIKSSSDFFKSACKAGPWVANATLDYQLKTKYPNLCAACDSPGKCSKTDKYWGRKGSLLCLTDGAGDISWARWDDVMLHFGLVPGGKEAPPDNYAMLCPDDTIREIGSPPCVWVVKPWSVVAAERSKAQEITNVLSMISRTKPSADKWQSALLNLMESYHVSIKPVVPIAPIESYLYKAVGFLSANSFPGCHPPRTIRMCTTSIAENFKCVWLGSVISSYGIEPGLDCLKADNTTHCMVAVQKNYADVVVIHPNDFEKATKEFNLKTLFYETVNDEFKYITVAVTKKNSLYTSLEDLRGTRACFPTFNGVAWNTMQHFLQRKCTNISAFFKDIYVLEGNDSWKNPGDDGALRCLVENKGDVAFLSKNHLNSFLARDAKNSTANDFQMLCEGDCFLSWATVGQAMVRQNSSELWIRDAIDVFYAIDENFGKKSKHYNGAFSLFSKFNGEDNLMFHDVTARIRTVPNLKISDQMPNFYENLISEEIKECDSSFSICLNSDRFLLFTALIVLMISS